MKPLKCEKKEMLELYLILVIFVISFLTFYLNFVNDPGAFNSDFSAYALAGRDILSGNILLNGWFGSTNSFYLISLIYGIAGKIGGYNVALYYPVTALVWAALISAIVYIMIKLNESASSTGIIVKSLFLVGLFMNSSYFTGSYKILMGTHIDVLIVGLLYVWTISQNIKNGEETTVKTTVLSALCFLAVISDDLFVILIFIPAIGVMLINLFIDKDNEKQRRIGRYLMLTTGILIAAKLFYTIAGRCFGAIQRPWPTNTISFISSNELFGRLMYFLELVLNALGINIFGKTIFALGNLEVFLRFLLTFLLFTFCCVCMFGMTKEKVKSNVFNQFLLCVVFFTFSIVTFTTYIVPSVEGIEYPQRIILYLIVPMVLFFSQTDISQNDKKLGFANAKQYRQLRIGLLLCACLLGIAGLSKIRYHTHEGYQNSKFLKIADTLNEKGLSRGYGTFWLANVTQLASESTVEVTPICDGSNLRVYQWLTHDTKNWDNANFILVDDSGWNGITRDSVINRVGLPDEEILIDNVSIMVYSKNIMEYIAGSGFDGRILDAWWDFEDGELIKEIKISGTSFASDFQPDDEGYFTSTAAGHLLYGPYRTVYSGTYNISFYYDSTDAAFDVDSTVGYVDICSGLGAEIHGNQEMQVGKNVATINNVTIEHDYDDIELRCYVKYPGITVRRIVIEKTS